MLELAPCVALALVLLLDWLEGRERVEHPGVVQIDAEWTPELAEELRNSHTTVIRNTSGQTMEKGRLVSASGKPVIPGVPYGESPLKGPIVHLQAVRNPLPPPTPEQLRYRRRVAEEYDKRQQQQMLEAQRQRKFLQQMLERPPQQLTRHERESLERAAMHERRDRAYRSRPYYGQYSEDPELYLRRQVRMDYHGEPFVVSKRAMLSGNYTLDELYEMRVHDDA